ncbi:hypothetical protein AB0C81_19255 [Streptomyces roseoverticillatus]|uniref:hypothetical protein n=1 Tax=Streptomyces roseoverticillatus TaxID=66429 RepID=UPI0033DC9AFB
MFPGRSRDHVTRHHVIEFVASLRCYADASSKTDANAPMRRVNDGFGYVPTHEVSQYRLDL